MIKAYLCFLESLLCTIPCKFTERWFFQHVGGIRERIGTRMVQGYFGAGIYWESYRKGQL
jgi:hypothetical protein